MSSQPCVVPSGGGRLDVARVGDLLRVRIGDPRRAADGGLDLAGAKEAPIPVMAGTTTTLDNGYTVRLDPASTKLEVCDALGRIIFSTAQEGIACSPQDVRLRIDYAGDERVYGLGQCSMQRLDLRDVERRIWHEVRSGPHPCVTGIPFLLSSRGYGMLVNSAFPSRFVIGRGRLAPPPVLAKQSRFAPAPWAMDESSGEESADRITVIVDNGGVEIFLMLAPSAKAILARHAALTGLPSLLPAWSLGYVQSRNRYRNEAELVALGREFRRRHVPCDVLVIDWYWFPEFGDFDWDASRWPDPEKMVRELGALGFKVMISLHPYVDRASRNWDRFKASGCLIEYPPEARAVTAHEGLLDITHPEGEAALRGAAARLAAQGAAAWWVDQTQPEIHPRETAHHRGSRERVHNAYPHDFIKALHAGQGEVNDARVVTLSFAAYVGSARYGGTTWTGDVDPTWEVLAEQVVIGQQLGLSGLPYWTTDIGGYVHYAHYDPELYLRWLQWGVFCPLFRTHTKRPDAEPWSWGDDVLEIARKSFALRYALVPYLEQLMHESASSGLPTVRPMWLEFPDDPAGIGRDHQFMLGTQVLVAPVLASGQRSVRVHLPPGPWFDAWTGQRHQGPAELDVFAPLERIPFFVRGGAIIAWDDSSPEWIDRPSKRCTVRLFPGTPASISLVFDDGVSRPSATPPSTIEIAHDGSLDCIRVSISDAGNGHLLPKELMMIVEDQAAFRHCRLEEDPGASELHMEAAYDRGSRTMRIGVSTLRPGSRFTTHLSA